MPTMAWYPNVALTGNHAVAFWLQYVPNTFDTFGNWLTLREGRWRGPRIVATGTGDGWDPSAALAGNQWLIAWPVVTGDQWTLHALAAGPTTITSGTGEIGPVAVALDERAALVVWRQHDATGAARLLAATSADGGLKWSWPVELPADAPAMPAIALSGQTAVTVWRQAAQLWATRSTDAGRTWSAPVALASAGNPTEPHLAMTGQRVVVAWTARDEAGHSIWARTSANGGATWEKPVCLRPAGADAGEPRVAVAAGKSVVVWQQRDGVINRIYASASTDQGRTWKPATAVTPGFGNAWGARATFAGSQLVVTWRQREEKQNSFWGAISADDGRTWSAPQPMFDGLSEIVLPGAAATIRDQYMAFEKTGANPVALLELNGSRALAVRMIRDAATWSLLLNTGEVGR
jgi:hypothetical protein